METSTSTKSPRDLLRLLIGSYFWLILLEGVLRKWYLQSLSDVLFIIRDPIVVLIYGLAVARGVFPARPAVVMLGVLAAASALAGLTTDAPLSVIIFGLRTNYLHPPLIFLMGVVLNRRDVERYCRWILICSIPILLLMMEQFRSGPDALVNAGVGGTEGGQLMGAMGRIRPSGPFSFTTGIVYYFSLVTAAAIYGWMRPGTYSRWLLIAATVTVVAAIPTSISRLTLMWVLVTGGIGGLAFVTPQNRIRVITAGIPLLALIGISLYFLRDSDYIMVFNARWENATSFDGGDFQQNVIGRLTNDYLSPFRLGLEAPLFGHGIGVGTIAGARLAGETAMFQLAEGELGRIVQELGFFLGFTFIGWRVWMALALLRSGWANFKTQHNPLAWLMAGASLMGLISAQWGQTTMLGFTVFSAGLSLAALNPDPADSSAEEAQPDITPNEIVVAEPVRRRRQALARHPRD